MATMVMRASTRFHRRMVMHRTSTISENADPTTAAANTNVQPKAPCDRACVDGGLSTARKIR